VKGCDRSMVASYNGKLECLQCMVVVLRDDVGVMMDEAVDLVGCGAWLSS
jgi:hypothetical protein